MADRQPTLKDLSEAIYLLALSQMRTASLLRELLDPHLQEMPEETREKVTRYLEEGFKDGDEIASTFEGFDW